jgi:parallel beta helix pectate lyase-like protein/calcineurin-like phosphoesterase family protein
MEHPHPVATRRLSLVVLTAFLLLLLTTAGPASGQLDAALAAVRPDADVAAGARALPGPFNTADPAACDHWVSTTGKDSDPGTQAQPWRTIRKAVTTLGTPGHGRVGCISSGTYDELGAVAAASGTPSAPIVLKRAPGSPTRPVVRLTDDHAALWNDRAYWIVDGLEYNLNQRRTTGIVLGGHHIMLRNAFVHDDARGAAIYVSGDDVTVRDGEVASNFHHDSNQDSHGVLVVAGAQRVLVKGNHIHDNGGDGVQCEYNGSSSDPQAPVDLTIEDNRLWTSPGNAGRTEQGVDIKSCRQVSIRGSVSPDNHDPNAANQKFFGFKNMTSAGRGGGAIVIHQSARNVLVENNRMWDSCHGIAIGRHDAILGIVEQVVVRRNVVFDMKAVGSGCRGYGIGIQRVNEADISHNTIDRIPAYGFQLGPNNQTGSRDRTVDFWNNIVRDATTFLHIDRSKIEGFASDYNLFWHSGGNQTRFRVDGADLTFGQWQSKADGASVLVADSNSRVEDPRFVAGAGSTEDYYTETSSIARDRALDNTNARFYGAGPDIGFRETYDGPSAGTNCTTGTAGQPWPSQGFIAQSGSFTAHVDLTSRGEPGDTLVGLSHGPTQTFTGLALAVRFNPAGFVDARNGSGWTASPLRYSANTTYRVRLAVDIAVHRYTAWVTPPGGSETAIGANLAFRSEQQAIGSLDTMMVAAPVEALQACNLRVATSTPVSAPVIAAAGDIACDPDTPGFDVATTCKMMATSELLIGANLTGVLTLGDNQYDNGAHDKFTRSYAPTWGRLKSITHPSAGNHEYQTPAATGYFDYFGAAAGDRGKGYYSFDIGGWHVVALNSNCSEVGGCHAGSPQERWLRADLGAQPAACTVAYMHHPRFSSGQHGSTTSVQGLWQALFDANAELVLSGHDHDYERFAPQTPTGAADQTGIRQFVVGTGGASLRAFSTVQPNSQIRRSDSHGVLQLTLHPDRYDWRFLPVAGKTFTDVGSALCH